MVPVVIKLWHQRCLFSRVRLKGHTKSHVQLSAASRWDSRFSSSIVSMSGYQLINKPAPLGISTLGPRPRSLPPNAGQAKHRFCSSSRPIRTLEVCRRISYCFYYVSFGLFDVTVMMKLYFMHIILYLLFTVFYVTECTVYMFRAMTL